MSRTLLAATLLSALSVLAPRLYAQAPAPSAQAAEEASRDPASLLGLEPVEAIARFGAPDRVYSVRGAEPWQDDVVFWYEGGLSLFLWKDRVWQVGFGAGYKGSALGLALGSKASQAPAALGSPARTEPGFVEWALPGSAWPVRARAVVDATGAVGELYVYRADF